jgi:hypothetical protein
VKSVALQVRQGHDSTSTALKLQCFPAFPATHLTRYTEFDWCTPFREIDPLDDAKIAVKSPITSQSTVLFHLITTVHEQEHCNFSVFKEDQSSQSHMQKREASCCAEGGISAEPSCTAILASSRKSNRLVYTTSSPFNSGWWSYLPIHPSKWSFLTCLIAMIYF